MCTYFHLRHMKGMTRSNSGQNFVPELELTRKNTETASSHTGNQL